MNGPLLLHFVFGEDAILVSTIEDHTYDSNTSCQIWFSNAIDFPLKRCKICQLFTGKPVLTQRSLHTLPSHFIHKAQQKHIISINQDAYLSNLLQPMHMESSVSMLSSDNHSHVPEEVLFYTFVKTLSNGDESHRKM